MNDVNIEEINNFEIAFDLYKSKESKSGNQYIIYLEAASDAIDQENEKILIKAIKQQKDFFLKYGIIDWDHKHKTKREPEYIIGEPLDVGFGKSIKNKEANAAFVKGFLYRGVNKAESVIKALEGGSTKLSASIGGGIFEKSKEFDTAAGKSILKIKQIRWDHVAITPSTMAVQLGMSVSSAPIGVFAKSLSSDVYFGCDKCKDTDCSLCGMCLTKALTAGVQTDATQITGGQALQKQSLEGSSATRTLYDKSILRIVSNIKTGKLKPKKKKVKEYLKSTGLSSEDSEEIIEFVINNQDALIKAFD